MLLLYSLVGLIYNTRNRLWDCLTDSVVWNQIFSQIIFSHFFFLQFHCCYVVFNWFSSIFVWIGCFSRFGSCVNSVIFIFLSSSFHHVLVNCYHRFPKSWMSDVKFAHDSSTSFKLTCFSNWCLRFYFRIFLLASNLFFSPILGDSKKNFSTRGFKLSSFSINMRIQIFGYCFAFLFHYLTACFL